MRAHTHAHIHTHTLHHQPVKGEKGDTFLKTEKQKAIISKSYIEHACQTGSKAELQFRPDMCLAIFILISLLRMAADSFCRMSPWEPRWKPGASGYCIDAAHIRRGGGGEEHRLPHATSQISIWLFKILRETTSFTVTIIEQKEKKKICHTVISLSNYPQHARAHTHTHTREEAHTKRPTYCKRDTKKDTWKKRHTEEEILTKKKENRHTRRDKETHKVFRSLRESLGEKCLQGKEQKGDRHGREILTQGERHGHTYQGTQAEKVM